MSNVSLHRRSFLLGASALSMLRASPSLARFPHGSASAAAFKPLLTGAGGYNQGASIGNDNTLLVRTDTYGAYKWNAGLTAPNGTLGVWQQIITSSSMPANFVSGALLNGNGVYEIQMCYKTPSVIYMAYQDIDATDGVQPNATVWKSINGGANWSRTAFTPVPLASMQANQSVYKEWGPKIAVDPNNPNVAYVGTQANGLFITTDGNAFTAVSTSLIPAPTGAAGYSGMQISAANSNNRFIFSDGNGVYGSTDGGTSWTHLTTGIGPTRVGHGVIDEGTGFYYAVDYSTNDQTGTYQNLWRWDGTTWTKVLTNAVNPVHGVAVDPNLSGHLIAISTNLLIESTDGGTTWPNGWSTSTVFSGTGDIGWTSNFGFGSSPWVFFDRSVAKTLYSFSDVGPWVTSPWAGTLASTTHVTFNMMGRGIEQLVANDVLAAPGGFAPVSYSWDFGTHTHSNLSAYPTTNGPVQGTFAAAWSVDYAPGTPGFVAMLSDSTYVFTGQHHATSTDGGQTWTPFTFSPYATFAGCIAVSTNLNWIMGDCQTRQPYFTLNGGSTWTAVDLSAFGVTVWTNTGGHAFGSVYNVDGRWMCADRVNANQFTIMYQGVGFFKTINGGTSWTDVTNGHASLAVGGSAQIKSVPGQANHIWLSWGVSSGNTFPNSAALSYFSTDAGLNWTQLTNFIQAQSFGFGKSAGAYPIVFGAGCVVLPSTDTRTCGATTLSFNITGTPAHTVKAGSSVYLEAFGFAAMRGIVVSYIAGVLTVAVDTVISGSGVSASNWTAYVFGIYRTASGAVAAPIWEQLATWPNNSLDFVHNVSGDPNIIGRCYISLSGSGHVYGDFP